jgi:hypothetical protein
MSRRATFWCATPRGSRPGPSAPGWDGDRGARAARLGGRLAEDPTRIARELALTKQGTEFLLYNWECLEAIVQSEGRWTEPQRDLAYDLLGVPHVVRMGTVKVPAGDDTAALRTLVVREIERLRISLPRLELEDAAERARAVEGVPTPPDAETLRLKSAASRAHTRLKWAEVTFDKLRRGADPSSLIDSETGRPIEAGPQPVAAPKAVPSPPRAAAASARPDPAAAPAPAPTKPIGKPLPYPEECTPETQELLGLLWETFQQHSEAGTLPPMPPTGAAPPAH